MPVTSAFNNTAVCITITEQRQCFGNTFTYSLVNAIWDCSKNCAFKKYNEVGPMFPGISWVHSFVQYLWRLGQNGRMKW